MPVRCRANLLPLCANAVRDNHFVLAAERSLNQ